MPKKQIMIKSDTATTLETAGEKKIGVYTLRCTENDNTVTFGCLGTVEETQAIKDSLHSRLSIDKKLHIEGIVSICNISGPYLISHKTLPIMYIDVIYSKSIVTYKLLTIRMQFTINDDQKIKSEFDLLNTKIKGTYSVDITIDNESTPIGDSEYQTFVSYNNTINRMEKMLKHKDMTPIYQDLIEKYEAERAKKYDNTWSYNVPVVTYRLENDSEEELEEDS